MMHSRMRLDTLRLIDDWPETEEVLCGIKMQNIKSSAIIYNKLDALLFIFDVIVSLLEQFKFMT